MSILEQLNKTLEQAEANIVGKKFVSIEVNGNVYKAISSLAGSHQSANNWARVDYQKNGKRISKANLIKEN